MVGRVHFLGNCMHGRRAAGPRRPVHVIASLSTSTYINYRNPTSRFVLLEPEFRYVGQEELRDLCQSDVERES